MKRISCFSSRLPSCLATTFVALAAAILLLGACTSTPTFDFSSPEAQELEDFTMNYYRAPDPGRAIELIPTITKIVAAKPESVTWPMAGFYAGVVATSPERAAEWRVLRDASRNQDWLQKAIDLGLDSEAWLKTRECPPEEMAPEILDFFWGCFSATGDPSFARLVIRRGGIVYPEWASLDLTQGSAAWSAKAQALNHPPVAAELDAYVLSATDAELRVFFHEAAGVASVRGILSPTALAHLDTLFAPPSGPVKTNVPSHSEGSAPEGDTP